MLSREQRSERVRQELTRRNLTRHAAHQRLDISRPSIEKLWEGRDVELEIIEKFARGLGLDINEWRAYWGYPLVDVSLDEVRETPQHVLTDGLIQLSREFNTPITLNWRDFENLTAEGVRLYLAELRRQLEEERAESQ